MADERSYPNQTQTLTAAIESGQGMNPDLVLLHVALALSRIGDQARGQKDLLRDFYHLAEEAFPVNEDGDA